MLQLTVFYTIGKTFLINDDSKHQRELEIEQFIQLHVESAPDTNHHLVSITIILIDVSIYIHQQVHEYFYTEYKHSIYPINLIQQHYIEIFVTQFAIQYTYEQMCQDYLGNKINALDYSNQIVQQISEHLDITRNHVAVGQFIQLMKDIVNNTVLKYQEIKDQLQTSCLALALSIC